MASKGGDQDCMGKLSLAASQNLIVCEYTPEKIVVATFSMMLLDIILRACLGPCLPLLAHERGRGTRHTVQLTHLSSMPTLLKNFH